MVIDTHLPENLKRNTYGLDRQRQRTSDFTGMPAIPTEDQAMNEGMGYVVDRTREHLGSTDVAIVAMRQRLLQLVRDLEAGLDPAEPHRPDRYQVEPLDIDSPLAALADVLAHV